jgi:anhydro-N-acetylmuramic acid kinase
MNISRLHDIAGKEKRLIIGLMSGTSLDGLDIALCAISGAGKQTQVELLQFSTVSYDADVKSRILSVFSKREVSLEKLCVLNPWLGKLHAAMILSSLKSWGIDPATVDIVASHGQTIYHAPKSLHQDDEYGPATLQIGDGDHIAVDTGIITLSDFRQKHIAAGGEGAPLAVYGDYLLCSHPTENRLLLNMGGIANFTYLPAGSALSEVFSTDTGPGNTLMDAYIRKHFPHLAYDVDGEIAGAGKINASLLSQLKSDTFFSVALPRTIGPELFNLEFLAAAQERSNTSLLSNEDVMATLNRFSAETIAQTILDYLPAHTAFKAYASGGGMHNKLLMQHLKQLLPKASFASTADLNIIPDAKEAVLFAVLANEALAGGAMYAGGGSTSIPVSMGKVSFPG